METFSEWKWAALSERRIYVFFVIEIICIFSWAVTANYSSHSNVYWRNYFGGETRSNIYWTGDSTKQVPVATYAPTLYHILAPAITFIHVVHVIWGWVFGPIFSSLFPYLRDSDAARFIHSSQGYKCLQFLGWSATLSMFYVAYEKTTRTWVSYLPPTDIYIGFCCMFSVVFAANQIGENIFVMYIRCAVGLPVWFVYYWYCPRVYSSIFEPLTVVAAVMIMIFTEICKENDLQHIYEQLHTARHRKLILLGEDNAEIGTSQTATTSNDVAYTLNTVVESLQALSTQLESLRTHEILPVRISSRDSYNREVTGYRWNKTTALIYEARLLCESVVLATISNPQEELQLSIQDLFHEHTFEFSQLCVRIFALMESARGHGMAFFVDNQNLDHVVTAAKGLIEMIIYLLLYGILHNASDANLAPEPCPICWVRCAIVNGAWMIFISDTRRTQNIDVPSMQPSSSLKLAAELTRRFMHINIDVSEYVDKASSIVTTHYSFPVPGKVLQDARAVDTCPSVMAGHSLAWLLIDLHTSAREERDNQRLMFSLKQLVIPFEVCNGTEQLRTWTKKHNVVVVTESGLHIKQMLVLFDVVRVTAGSLIVVSEGKTASHFRDLYDIEVAYCMGTSESSVYQAVQYVYEKHTPRALSEEKLCSAK